MSTKPASFIGLLETVTDDNVGVRIVENYDRSRAFSDHSLYGTIPVMEVQGVCIVGTVVSLDPKIVGSSAERERGRASGTTNDSSGLTGRD